MFPVLVSCICTINFMQNKFLKNTPLAKREIGQTIPLKWTCVHPRRAEKQHSNGSLTKRKSFKDLERLMRLIVQWVRKTLFVMEEGPCAAWGGDSNDTPWISLLRLLIRSSHLLSSTITIPTSFSLSTSILLPIFILCCPAGCRLPLCLPITFHSGKQWNSNCGYICVWQYGCRGITPTLWPSGKGGIHDQDSWRLAVWGGSGSRWHRWANGRLPSPGALDHI